MFNAHYISDTKGYRYTIRICNIYCFSTAKMFARTILSVRFIRIFPLLFLTERARGRKILTLISPWLIYEGGADKSLARPGRKQATATKPGIYSTYSPQSSIHFLVRCSNFCKPLKKKIRSLSVQPGLRDSNGHRVGGKMAAFHLFFQSR